MEREKEMVVGGRKEEEREDKWRNFGERKITKGAEEGEKRW